VDASVIFGSWEDLSLNLREAKLKFNLGKNMGVVLNMGIPLNARYRCRFFL
jgi:hypothetical protein